MFELPVQGVPNTSVPDTPRWVLVNGNAIYLVRDFDGRQSVPDSGLLLVDHGRNLQATQT